MTTQSAAWTATGIIEAPLDRVAAVVLKVAEGPVSAHNAPMLATIPGVSRARLVGGPDEFGVYYGQHAGGTVTVDRAHHRFVFSGGYKFRAEYEFTEHGRGTLMTYRAYNIAPSAHQSRARVRIQFWLGSKLKVGLRGALRRIGQLLDCPTHTSA